MGHRFFSMLRRSPLVSCIFHPDQICIQHVAAVLFNFGTWMNTVDIEILWSKLSPYELVFILNSILNAYLHDMSKLTSLEQLGVKVIIVKW